MTSKQPLVEASERSLSGLSGYLGVPVVGLGSREFGQEGRCRTRSEEGFVGRVSFNRTRQNHVGQGQSPMHVAIVPVEPWSLRSSLPRRWPVGRASLPLQL